MNNIAYTDATATIAAVVAPLDKTFPQYEDAVIAKRLEELADDEVNALLDEIDRDEKLGI